MLHRRAVVLLGTAAGPGAMRDPSLVLHQLRPPALLGQMQQGRSSRSSSQSQTRSRAPALAALQSSGKMVRQRRLQIPHLRRIPAALRPCSWLTLRHRRRELARACSWDGRAPTTTLLAQRLVQTMQQLLQRVLLQASVLGLRVLQEGLVVVRTNSSSSWQALGVRHPVAALPTIWLSEQTRLVLLLALSRARVWCFEPD